MFSYLFVTSVMPERFMCFFISSIYIFLHVTLCIISLYIVHVHACLGVVCLCAGLTTCLIPVLLVDLFTVQKLSHSFGLILLFQGIGATVGPPLAGMSLY